LKLDIKNGKIPIQTNFDTFAMEANIISYSSVVTIPITFVTKMNDTQTEKLNAQTIESALKNFLIDFIIQNLKC
jgi:hypothetical protein